MFEKEFKFEPYGSLAYEKLKKLWDKYKDDPAGSLFEMESKLPHDSIYGYINGIFGTARPHAILNMSKYGQLYEDLYELVEEMDRGTSDMYKSVSRFCYTVNRSKDIYYAIYGYRVYTPRVYINEFVTRIEPVPITDFDIAYSDQSIIDIRFEGSTETIRIDIDKDTDSFIDWTIIKVRGEHHPIPLLVKNKWIGRIPFEAIE